MRVSDALELTHQGKPAAPISSRTLLYVKSGNRVYIQGSDGTEIDVGSWGNLTGKPSTFPPDPHNHDAAYSLLGHGHSGYATDTHTHSGYASTTHASTHGIGGSDVLSPASIGASSTSHGHAGIYAGITHAAAHASGASDALSPAAIGAATSGHNHDTAYATLGHGHTGYASSTHNHDTAYSATTHNHDAAYAGIGHTHTEAAVRGCRFTRGSNQIAVAGSTYTQLIIGTRDWANPIGWGNNTGDYTFICPTGEGGLYDIFIKTVFVANSTGNRRLILMKNSTAAATVAGAYAGRTIAAASSGATVVDLYLQGHRIAAGDYFIPWVWHSSTGSLSPGTADDMGVTEISFIRIGP